MQDTVQKQGPTFKYFSDRISLHNPCHSGTHYLDSTGSDLSPCPQLWNLSFGPPWLVDLGL